MSLNRPHMSPQLTEIDQIIFAFEINVSHNEEYTLAIADRNDYAIMLARTTLAKAGCRATRDRVMPA